jgi:hypothetical protein
MQSGPAASFTKIYTLGYLDKKKKKNLKKKKKNLPWLHADSKKKMKEYGKGEREGDSSFHSNCSKIKEHRFHNATNL